ncbi:FlgD immunoglobulin-like domain containing protein [Spirochaeta cellobiosiphila]|uniref:FlgD immunoglobulin-like domain containing protein n=1 Tax=Spirochaeta cellobiosiphila TaxID=504483 RepID=UPI001B7F7D92|nr:FlgD immunoglobulin-like domain containing protein [Spirochaeta cellobiosiphila]
MKRFCLLILFIVPLSSANGATIFWGGGSGNWSVGTNWLSGVVPTSADDVYILSGSPTLDIDTTVGSLEMIGGSLTLTGQGLIINNDMTISGASSITNGTIDVAGNLDINYVLSVNSTAITVGGNVTSSSPFTILSAVSLTVGGNVSFSDIITGDSFLTLELNGAGTQSLASSSDLGILTVSNTSGTVTLNSDLTLDTLNLLNGNTIALGGNTLFFTGDWALANDVSIGNGIIDVSGSFDTTSLFSVSSALTIVVQGDVDISGTITNDNLFTLELSGTVAQSLRSTSDIGIITVSNTSDTVTLNSNLTIDTLNFTDGNIIGLGGNTLSLTGDWILANSVSLSDGSVDVTSNMTISSNASIDTIVLTIGGELNSNSPFSIINSLSATVPGNVTISGNITGYALMTLYLTGTASQTVDLSNTNNGTINISKTAGSVTFTNDTVMDSLTIGTNKAFDIITTANITVTNSVSLDNTGSVQLGNADTDIATFTGGFSHTLSTLTLYGSLITTDSDLTIGVLTLGSNGIIDTNSSASGGAIIIASVSGSNYDLTMSSGQVGTGESDINITGAITGLNSLVIDDAYDVTLNSVNATGDLVLYNLQDLIVSSITTSGRLLIGTSSSTMMDTASTSAVNSVVISGAISTGGVIRIIASANNSATALSLSGVDSNGADIELRANDDITLGASFESSTGGASLYIGTEDGSSNIGMGDSNSYLTAGSGMGITDVSLSNVLQSDFSQLYIGLTESGDFEWSWTTPLILSIPVSFDFTGGTGSLFINNTLSTINGDSTSTINFVSGNPTLVLAGDLLTDGADINIDIPISVVSSSSVSIDTEDGDNGIGGDISITKAITGDGSPNLDLSLSSQGTTGGDISLFDATVLSSLSINSTGTTDGSIYLNGNLMMQDEGSSFINLSGPVILSASLTIDSANSSNDGTITVNDTINADASINDRDLTMNTGSGIVLIGDDIGGVNSLDDLIISSGTVQVENITIEDDLDINAVTQITFFADTGDILIDTTADNAGGLISMTGNILLDGNGFSRTFTFDSNGSSSGNDITFDNQVISVTSEVNALTLDAGSSGDITVSDTLGSTAGNELGDITVIESNDVSLNRIITLGGDLSFGSSGNLIGGTLTFNDDINTDGDTDAVAGSISIYTTILDLNASAANGSITLDSQSAPITGSQDIYIETGTSFNSEISWDDGLTILAAGANVDLSSSNILSLDHLDISATSVVLGDALLGTGDGNGGVSLDINTTGNLSLYGDIDSTGEGAGANIDLGADITGVIVLSSGGSTDATDISLVTNGNVDFKGARYGSTLVSLTIDTGTGTLTTYDSLGLSSTPIGVVDITGNAAYFDGNHYVTGNAFYTISDVYINSDFTLDTSSGDGKATFTGNLSSNASSFALVITTGDGDIQIDGVIGYLNPFTTIDLTANDIVLSGITTSGATNGATGNVVLTSSDSSSLENGYVELDDASYLIGGNFTITSGSEWTQILNTNNKTFDVGGAFTVDSLVISASGCTITMASDFTADYWAVLNGTVNLSGSLSITLTNDLILLGSNFNNNDTDRVIGTDYEWEYPDKTSVFPSLSMFDTSSPSFTGLFDSASLDGDIINIGRNLYVNGSDLNATTSLTLNVKDNSSFKPTFNDTTPSLGSQYSLVYNSIITNISVSGGIISAAENIITQKGNNVVDGGGNTTHDPLSPGSVGFDFDAPYLLSAETVSDNIIRLTFSEPIENTNNEISSALANLYVNGDSTLYFTGSYIDNDGDGSTYPFDLITTDGQGDLSTFFIKTSNTTWNTDADGTSTGGAYSTDRQGTSQSIIPYLSTLKGVFWDSGAYNLSPNYGTNSFPSYTAITDETRPVLVAVELVRHDLDVTSGDTIFDGHNAFQLHYSEPVSIDKDNASSEAGFNVDATGAFDTTPDDTTSIRVTDTAGVSGNWGGYVLQNGINHLEVVGFFETTNTVEYKSGSKDGTLWTDSISRGSISNDYGPNGVVITLVGYQDANGYPGYFYNDDGSGNPSDITYPNGYTITVPSNTNIADSQGNLLEPTVVTGYSNYDAKSTVTITEVSPWDIERPEVAPYISNPDDSGITWGGADQAYEIVSATDSSTNKVNKMEFHFLDNYSEGWDSLSSWDKTIYWDALNHPDSTGGIRDSSFTYPIYLQTDAPYLAFSFEEAGVTPLLSSYTDGASSSVSNLLFTSDGTANGTVDDPYYTLTIDPSGGHNWNRLSNLWVNYDESLAYITDRAGNLLRSFTSLHAIEKEPPEISFSLAAANSDVVYVYFNEPVYTVGSVAEDVEASDFNLNNLPGISIKSLQVIDRGEDSKGIANTRGGRGIFLTLSHTLTADQIIDGKILASSDSIKDLAGNVMDSTNEYRISNLGLNILTPVWASDSINDSTEYIDGNEERRDFSAISIFDGSERLRDEDITLEVINSTKNYQSQPVLLNYDIAPKNLSQIINTGLWLTSFISELIPQANIEARTLSPYVNDNNLYRFVIPGIDDEIQAESMIEFTLMLGGLECVNIINLKDPRTIQPWKFQIKDVVQQRGGVTILNNVINPVKGDRTIISYDLDSAGIVVIQVFALDGSLVRVLKRGRQSSGEHMVSWNGTNESGNMVARGIYFVRVTAAGGIDEYRKVLVVKD